VYGWRSVAFAALIRDEQNKQEECAEINNSPFR